jgi:hypothetical protein
MKQGLALRNALRSLIVPVAVSLLLVVRPSQTTSPYFFEVTLRASTRGIAQLFYDATGGDDAREANSARVQLDAVENRLRIGSHCLQGSTKGFRFDPIDRQGTVAISGTRIVRVGRSGAPDLLVSISPVSQYRAAHYVSSLKASGDETQVVTTENANDPILIGLV